MVYWKKSESSMNFNYSNDKLGTSFNRISAVVLLVAAGISQITKYTSHAEDLIPVEHSLSITNAYFGIKEENYNSDHQFFKDEYPFVFNYIPYHIGLGIFLKVVNSSKRFIIFCSYSFRSSVL